MNEKKAWMDAITDTKTAFIDSQESLQVENRLGAMLQPVQVFWELVSKRRLSSYLPY